MPNRDLRVTLIGDDRTGTAFGSAGRSADSLSSRFASLGRGVALALGGAAAAGIAGLGAALVQGARDAASYEQIGNQVAQTIQATGGVAGVTADGLRDYAGQLESMSGVDEELILSSQNVLLTFTNIRNAAGEGNDVFDQASQAALNLSTTMGGDLVGASTMVGKALNDPINGITSLSRAGVTFTDVQKDQIRAMVESGDTMGAQQIILGELSKEFGGAAEAAGSGLTGSIARAKDAFQDMFRGIATALLPKLADLATFFTQTLMPGIGGVYNLVIGGDFTGALREAFGWDEDSGVVTFLLNLRENIIALWPRVQAAGAQLLNLAQVVLPALWSGLVTVSGAVQDAVGFFRDHEGAARALGIAVGVVAGLVAAAWVAQAAVSTANAFRSVQGWFSVATASTTSATIQERSTAQIVLGWAWAAVQAAAQAVRVVASWVLMGVQAVASAAVTAAAWVGAQIRTVASLVVMAAGFVAQGAVMIASAAATAAGVVAGWVLMGAQALLQGARMAAAWLIAMGPVGWVIAGVVALVALIVANWDTVVSWTQSAWSAVTGAIGAAWDWIRGAVGAALDFLVGLFMNFTGPGLIISHWNDIVNFTRNAWSNVTGAVSGAWSNVTGAISSGVSTAVSFVAGLPGQLLGAIGNMGSLLYQRGRDLIQGLINGAGSLLSRIGQFFLDLVPSWIRGPFESALGINSPSKVFAGYGVNIGQGLINGMASMQPAVADAVTSLMPPAPGMVQAEDGSWVSSGFYAGVSSRPRATAPPPASAAYGAGGTTADQSGLLAALIDAISSRPTIGTVVTQRNETGAELGERLAFMARTSG